MACIDTAYDGREDPWRTMKHEFTLQEIITGVDMNLRSQKQRHSSRAEAERSRQTEDTNRIRLVIR